MRRWSVVAVGGLALAGVGFAQTGPGHSVLRSAGLVAPQPAYTALAFAHPQQLLTQLFSTEALLETSFVIQNLSPGSRAYAWHMVEVHDGRRLQVASGRTKVGGGRAATISKTVLTSCASGRLEVVVSLTTPSESIAYSMMCPAGNVSAAPSTGERH